MKFTGIDLARVRQGVTLAIAELKNQIGTCPDVNAYASELDALDDEVYYFQQLQKRIDLNIKAEKKAEKKAAKTLGYSLTPNQYIGKVCPKHPELKGLRSRPSYRCVKCMSDYQSQRMRLKRTAEKANNV